MFYGNRRRKHLTSYRFSFIHSWLRRSRRRIHQWLWEEYYNIFDMTIVDHFCRKCWVGAPIRPDVKKRIWCSLFGRPLGFGGRWEVIVRCFDPYMEVYQRVAALMQTYGAEPLIEGPESLDIGNRGVVRIAPSLQTGQLPGGRSSRIHNTCKIYVLGRYFGVIPRI